MVVVDSIGVSVSFFHVFEKFKRLVVLLTTIGTMQKGVVGHDVWGDVFVNMHSFDEFLSLFKIFRLSTAFQNDVH